MVDAWSGAWSDPAVIARNALMAVDSVVLTSDGRCGAVLATTLDDTHVTLDDGRVVLAVPPGTPLAGVRSPRGRRPVVRATPVALHVTDLAPLPVRDRVRARVAVVGDLGTVDAAAMGDTDMAALRPLIGDVGELWVISPRQVLVETRGRLVAVAERAWRSARADVLACREASYLAEFAGDADLLGGLVARIPVATRADSRRILPLSLDSWGVVLRAERPDGHADVRLAFDREVSRAADLRPAALRLARARGAAGTEESLTEELRNG